MNSRTRLAAGVFLVLACQSTGRASESSQIGDSGLWIIPPRGWQLAPVYTPGRASLHFNLPKDPKTGGTPAYPSISIEEMPDAASLADIASDIRIRHPDEFAQPSVIAGFPALVLTWNSEVVYDFVGGGSATGTVAVRQEFFETPRGVFRCELEAADDKQRENYLDVLNRFCQSVRLPRR